MTSDTAPADAKPRSPLAPTIVRYLMGVPLVAFGIMNFVMKQNDAQLEQSPAAVAAFSRALYATGYMMPLIATTLLLSGLLLVSNRFVPLALAIFAPFIVNSMAFHAFLDPKTLPMPMVFLAFELYLAWAYRAAFAPMLAARVRPQ